MSAAETSARDASLERVEFETLLSDISAQLLAAPLEDLDRIVETALDQVRAFFGADRCGLLAVHDSLRVTISHGAVAPGIDQPERTIDLATWFPWVAHKLLVERVPVVIPRVADLPPEAAHDRAAFQAIGTQSNLTVPILQDGGGGHLIILGAVRQECAWPEEYLPRLRLLGEMFLGALDRRRAFEALRTSEARLERAAAAGACGLWELDAASGRIWATETARHLYGASPHEPVSWEWFVRRLHPEDRDPIVARMTAVLAGTGSFDERYRIVLDDGVVRWLHVTARRRGPHHLEGASVDVTNTVEAEVRAQTALDEVRRLRDQLQSENRYLRQETHRQHGTHLVVGRSAALRRVLGLVEQVAPTSATVLITGETGTGKERIATLIHDASPRKSRTMVRVNCSAIPTALIEAELFGREKGAYTGALSKQVGRFELAHGSTLFLDEVGDLPLDVQIKLLRVLQEQTLERLGSPKPVRVDVRIVAATHRDLELAVHKGTFRSDLYYRLNVFPIDVPPLRQRLDDLPDLVTALVEEIGSAIGKRFDAVAKSSLDHMRRYSWPGNVRELRNVLERAMILGAGPTLHVELPTRRSETAAPGGPGTGSAALEDIEREHIVRVLTETGWRIKGPGSASVRLGLKPSTLYFRLKKLGITRPRQAVLTWAAGASLASLLDVIASVARAL